MHCLETCEPTLKAQVRPRAVRLDCKLNGAGKVRIHVRIKGEDWRVLVDDWETFPIDDGTPVAIPGTEEVREYRATPVEFDREVGQASEIVTVNVPGWPE